MTDRGPAHAPSAPGDPPGRTAVGTAQAAGYSGAMHLLDRDRRRRPDPEPLKTDDTKVFVAGTAVWAALLVATWIGHDWITAHGNQWWSWTCVAGIALGLVGLADILWRRRPR